LGILEIKQLKNAHRFRKVEKPFALEELFSISNAVRCMNLYKQERVKTKKTLVEEYR
jgi:hypothetical protein